MNPELLIKFNPEDNKRRGWWLCAVANSTSFAMVGELGDANDLWAATDYGVVPKVLFG